MSGGEVGLAAAFAGGVASFASPCVLPLVPAYLSVVAGLDVTRSRLTDEAGNPPRRVGAIARDTALFVAGFSAVFVLLGLTATEAGRAIGHHQALLTRVSGVVMVAMALFLLGTVLVRSPWLYGERRFHPHLARFGPFAAPVAGAAFGLGWTPCIGPVLASVLSVAAAQGQAIRGAELLLAYSAGLGLPFLIAGVAFDQVRGALLWVRRHAVGVTGVSAGAMGGFGMLLVLDRLAWVTTQVQRVL